MRLAALALLCGVIAAAEEPPSAVPLPATFLQLWNAHRQWDDLKWDELFRYLGELQVREVVVQWTSYDDVLFDAELERVFSLAEGRGMGVWLGLSEYSTPWITPDQSASLMRASLSKRAARNQALAAGLARRFAARRSFRGWYIPEEVDDVNWRAGDRLAVLRGYLKRVSGSLRKRTPRARVAISGFTNLQLSPRQLAEFWRSLASKASLDVLLLQDGVGVGKVPLAEWPRYLTQFASEFQGLKAELRVIVETFEQTSASPFAAVPAPISRILQQAELARRVTGRDPVAFSLPEYLTPLGGPEAAARYSEYKAWIFACR